MQLAVFSKAPQAGAAKTRLIPLLGAHGAARLQRGLTLHTLQLACRFRAARTTLWCAPDDGQRFFRALRKRFGLRTRPQQGSDLGARMANAFGSSVEPTILIGCDCPALELGHLAETAELLAAGHDAVFIPAEDGGYVLVALRSPQPRLFEDITWGSDAVMAQTRDRLRELGLRWAEPRTLWDLDRPTDLERLASTPARIG